MTMIISARPKSVFGRTFFMPSRMRLAVEKIGERLSVALICRASAHSRAPARFEDSGVPFGPVRSCAASA